MEEIFDTTDGYVQFPQSRISVAIPVNGCPPRPNPSLHLSPLTDRLALKACFLMCNMEMIIVPNSQAAVRTLRRII